MNLPDHFGYSVVDRYRTSNSVELTHHDDSRSLLQHNQAFCKLIRDGVPVSCRDAQGALRHAQARVIDFREPANNRFLVVRELKVSGLRTRQLQFQPGYCGKRV